MSKAEIEAFYRKFNRRKRAERKRRAALPIDEKLRILERLRDRDRAIAATPLAAAYRGKPGKRAAS